MSPGSGMSEEERRELIARQRNALYGEGASFSENGGFDENGTPRPGSGSQSAGIRGHSPLAFGSQGENASQPPAEPQSATSQAPGQQRSRANCTSSPASHPTIHFSPTERASQQASQRAAAAAPQSTSRQR